MALITFPYDLLADFPGWSTEFKLNYRQDRSRSAGGTTYVKDMGSPIWRTTYSSRTMRPNELDKWRAKLDLLDGGLNTFLGVPLSRCYPIAYPNGSGQWASPWNSGITGQGSLSSIVTPNKEIRLAGLPANYQLNVGDMIRIGTRNLHRVMTAAVATGGGFATVEIRPPLWPESVAGAPVYFRRPFCNMVVDPDSISTTADKSTGMGTISFDGWEYR